MDVGGRAEPMPAAMLPLVSVLSPNETELARLLDVQDIGETDQEVSAIHFHIILPCVCMCDVIDCVC
jgi:sugar/nucleoside kinase (ribokinase family)